MSLPATIALTIFTITSLPAADQPKFETASVKRSDQCIPSNSLGPGTVVLRGLPLKPILIEAFKVRNDQIVGPTWLDEDCFEIVARMPEGSTSDQIPAMLQALLIERFKLAARKENRPRQVYVLIVDKNGPKFKETDLSSDNAHPGNVRFSGAPGITGFKGQITMASLARLLSKRVNQTVEDLTGLKGTYDIDLSWAPDPAFEAHPNAELPPSPAADLFTAIRESLGLRLESRKEPVEVLVIDHMERVPTEN